VPSGQKSRAHTTGQIEPKLVTVLFLERAPTMCIATWLYGSGRELQGEIAVFTMGAITCLFFYN